MSKSPSVVRISLSIAAIAGISALYAVVVQVNPTTVALSYLMAILFIATMWGIAEATAASVAATVLFNLLFLPPVGVLTIADPQHWISFVAFMVTAVVASQLSGRARQRRLDAVARQRDLERLYAFSRALLLVESGPSGRTSIVRHMVEIFDLPFAALYDHEADTVYRAGSVEVADVDTKLRDVARRAIAIQEASGLTVTAIRLGGAPIGSLALLGGGFSDTVLQSLANLTAIELERARARETSARAEAARQSGELRAAVLDAVAHEFKTPLTSIKMAASTLASGTAPAAAEELVAIISEEADRLQATVTDAVQMLRIDAGEFVLNRERLRLAGIVDALIAESRWHLSGHTLVNRVPGDLVAAADPILVRLALRQLLDNAVKYSMSGSRIVVDGTNGPPVTITVSNPAPEIPAAERKRIFERFYRGPQAGHVPGTGMGLAIVRQIAEAHGGAVTVLSEGGTTRFQLSLPVHES